MKLNIPVRPSVPSSKRPLLPLLLVLFALLGSAMAETSPRAVLPLADGWRFHQGVVTEGAGASGSGEGWQTVTVPHSWSNAEAVPGKGFYSGESWYSRSIEAQPAWRGGRVFLRFDAVSLVAEVFLNGKRLGEHHGGFAAFTYEITDALRYDGENKLMVRVDNRRRHDISPLGGDFTIYGGIYRPVSLIVTGQVAITPLDYGSPGVFLKQAAVSAAEARVEVTTEVSNGASGSADVAVRLTVTDKAGRTVLSKTTPGSVATGETGKVAQSFTIAKPHLWNGVADPYLYSVQIDLLRGGKVVDRSTQPLGLRSFHVDPKKGFVLNGVASQIHGICLHQEIDSHGWAVTPAEERNDLRIMREMGVNGVRLVHYQHSQSFIDAADEQGVLVWAELAQVDRVDPSPEYADNVKQQLLELIRQNYNHPSIFVWSMYNELGSQTRPLTTALVGELNRIAHQEDPTRPTTGAASGDTIANMHDMVATEDLISVNLYDGWYSGKPEEIGAGTDKWNKFYDSRGISLSEYGSGASILQHKQGLAPFDVKARSNFHPEEWQAIAHEGNYKELSTRPEVWGTFVWVMYDFASIGRHEGDTDGVNDKGLVTRDRKTTKDAYHFYQASWTTKPMVYLNSRRDTVRSQAVTEVKVYSNKSSVTLTVNGKSVGPGVERQPHVFVWKNITLAPGENRVKATVDGATDECLWTYTAPTT